MFNKTLMKLYWRPCRIASLLVIVLSLGARWLIRGEVELSFFTLDLACAITLVMLVPMAMNLGLWMRNLTLAIALTDVLWIFYVVLFIEQFCELTLLGYLSLSLVPILVCNVLLLVDLSRDDESIPIRISASEVMVLSVRYFESIIYVVIVCLGALTLGQIYPAISSVTLCLLSFLYLVIMVRSLLKDYYAADGSIMDESGKKLRIYCPFKRVGRPASADKSLYNRLDNLMREKELFLRSDLKVEDIASELGTNRTYASRLINNCAGVKFNEFVNRYRIKYALVLIKSDPKVKVSNLPFLTGFRNQVTFNNAFKLETGFSPKEWTLKRSSDLKQNVARRPGRPASPSID